MRTLSGMTPEQIVAEQEELMRLLGSDVVEMIKARKHRKQEAEPQSSSNTAGDPTPAGATGESKSSGSVAGVVPKKPSAHLSEIDGRDTETAAAPASKSALAPNTGVTDRASAMMGQSRKGTITKVPVDALGNMPIQLPFTPDKSWVSMDEVELEKVEWMQPMARPSKEGVVLFLLHRVGIGGWCLFVVCCVKSASCHTSLSLCDACLHGDIEQSQTHSPPYI